MNDETRDALLAHLARNALRDYMMEISRRAWSSEWMYELSYLLWQAWTGRTQRAMYVDDPTGIRLGRTRLTVADLDTIDLLVKTADGWWDYDEEANRTEFVPMSQWLDLYASWPQNRD